MTKGPEAEELMELNGKWDDWEKLVGKASGLQRLSFFGTVSTTVFCNA